MAGTGGLVGGSALDEELKRSNVVRLRGIPFSATEGEITEFFKDLEIGTDGVVICVNFQGRSSGQAYVQFASTEIANKALERNRQFMGSRYVEVFKGHPADMQGALRMVGRGTASGIGSGSIVNTGIPGMAGSTDIRYTGVIRMRGMPYSCTSADIKAFFKGMEIVPDGIYLCAHADGRPTGEAFVEFADEETATRAMQLHREPMGSRYVELFRSTKGEMMTVVQQRMFGLFAGFGGLYGSMGQLPGVMGSFGLQGLAGMNLAAMQAAGLGMGMPAVQGVGDLSESMCVKMRGLPFNAQPKDIMEFFEGYTIAPNGIHILTGVSDRPTGEAFVEFVSADEAQRAMERHRHNMGSRYIELFRATKNELLIALGGLAGLHMSQALDPSIQLLLLQQQAAAGAFSMSSLMSGGQGAGNAAAAANFYQRQSGSTGSASFDQSSGKVRGAPYRSLS